MEQGFEAHVRRHDIHAVHMAQNTGRVRRLAKHDRAGVVSNVGQIPALGAPADLWMRFDVERRVGIFPPSSGQHLGEGFRAGQSILHARIADGLIHDQYSRAVTQEGCGAQVRRQVVLA
ncbi:hypothetical protein D3C73_1109410 [compost metagenome]